MLIGDRYRSELIDDHYDVIVIGSGIGGLTTAALLAKVGKKVLVLERHYTAGGYTHTYTRKGYEWDVGLHYVGQVHRKGSFPRRVFDYITDGQLDWAPMDDNYDTFVIGDERFPFMAGRSNLKRDLIAWFPDEEKAILRYFELLDEVNRAIPYFFAPRIMPSLLGFFCRPLFSLLSTDPFKKTTLEVLSEITDNKKLIGVLTGQWGDAGLPPARSSFGIHAMIAGHYLSGGAYPVGGSSRIAATIKPVIESAGGQVLVRAEVDEILVRHGRAYGVRMANGDIIKARDIVSSAGVYNTFEHLLSKEVADRYRLRQKLEKVSPSAGHVGLYIGLRESAASLGIKQSNIWVYPSEDHDGNVDAYVEGKSKDLPVVYISFPSAKDPDWDRRYPDRATIEVVSVALYERFAQWENEPWRKRGPEYEALKQKIADELLEHVYQQVPQVRGKVDYYELSTPLSTRHFSNYQWGELYGINPDCERFHQNWLKPRTPISHLFLTGQDILSAGICGAMGAGICTTSAVLGPGMLKLFPDLFFPAKDQSEPEPVTSA